VHAASAFGHWSWRIEATALRMCFQGKDGFRATTNRPWSLAIDAEVTPVGRLKRQASRESLQRRRHARTVYRRQHVQSDRFSADKQIETIVAGRAFSSPTMGGT
jgi:hypothetical protein